MSRRDEIEKVCREVWLRYQESVSRVSKPEQTKEQKWLEWLNRPIRPLTMWRTPMARKLSPSFASYAFARKHYPESWADPKSMPEGMWEWFEETVQNFNRTIGDMGEGIQLLREASKSDELPLSKQELKAWVIKAESLLVDLADRFFLQGAALVSDAQVNEKQRQRGREDMKQLNQKKSVPQELIARWQKKASEIRLKRDAGPWTTAGWICKDEKLNPHQKWPQKTIHRHIRPIFSPSRIS